MKYPKLRIAWSVGWGIACLLLIALWVRSYWRYDVFSVRINEHGQLVTSLKGELTWDGAASLAKDSEVFHWSAYRVEGVTTAESPPTMRPFLGFRWTMVGQSPLPIIPYWFPVFVLAALAAIPWFRWRFSLRTLLIAITLVAVGLGVIVWAFR